MYIGLTNVNPDFKFMSTPPGLNFGMSVSQPKDCKTGNLKQGEKETTFEYIWQEDRDNDSVGKTAPQWIES